MAGFSCPSMVPCWSAVNTSGQAMATAWAPMAFRLSTMTGLSITRIFNPFRSAGDFTGRLELVSCRNPFSYQTTPCSPDFSNSSRIWRPMGPSKTL